MQEVFIAELQRRRYLWQEERIANLETLKTVLLQGELHLRAAACFPFLLSSFSVLYSIASPSLSCPLLLSSLSSFFSPSLSLYSHCNFVLFFLLQSPPSVFSAPPFPLSVGVLDHRSVFGARLRQYFTLIKKKKWLEAPWEKHRNSFCS